jgi:glucokinase
MNANFAIGIDTGATNTKIGLVDSSATIVDCHTIASDLRTHDPSHFLTAVYRVVEQYVQAHVVQGIGIALCSLINEEHTGALLSVNAPALNHLNIKQTFESRFGCPVQVLNDVNAYALAEYHCGAGEETKRLLCVGLGTGVAIACIINGRLLETWAGITADAARVILDPHAEVTCNANVRGSAEALCGTAHLLRLARLRYAKDDITVRDIITAAREGHDPTACQIMTEIGGHLGHLLAILSPIFFPQKIVITGGTAEAGEPLFSAAQARYSALIGAYMTSLSHLETGTARPVHICKGALGPEAAVIGAALGFLPAQTR